MGGDKETSFARIPNNTKSAWWRDTGLRINVLHCMGCCLCPFYLGYDQTLLAGVQAIPSWNSYFGTPTSNLLGIITASLFLPAIFCSFLGDWLCTRFGRRITVMVGSVFIIAGGAWNGMSQSLAHFIASRVIVGIGGGITKVAAPALLHELAHPRLRATMGTMYYGFYHFGGAVSGVMCIAGLFVPNTEWQWRLPCFLQVFGPLVVLTIVILSPESPRWLASKGRVEQARAILVKHHANGKEDDELVEYEFREIVSTLEQESLKNKSRYVDFFKTPGNRKRLWVTVMLGIGSNWVGNGILGYYLAPVLRSVGIRDPLTITGLNAGLAAFNMIASLTFGVFSEYIGRRPMWIISNAGMGFGFCFIMGFAAAFANTGNTGFGLAVIPFIFIVYGFYDLAWIALNYTYVAEFMPYNLRTKGLALYITFNNLGNAFAQFVNPIALAAMQWRYYAVYIALDFFVALIAYLHFPETRRLSIEEISLVFDYGTKEGRERALHDLETARHANDPKVNPDVEMEKGDAKPDIEHLEEGRK